MSPPLRKYSQNKLGVNFVILKEITIKINKHILAYTSQKPQAPLKNPLVDIHNLVTLLHMFAWINREILI